VCCTCPVLLPRPRPHLVPRQGSLLVHQVLNQCCTGLSRRRFAQGRPPGAPERRPRVPRRGQSEHRVLHPRIPGGAAGVPTGKTSRHPQPLVAPQHIEHFRRRAFQLAGGTKHKQTSEGESTLMGCPRSPPCLGHAHGVPSADWQVSASAVPWCPEQTSGAHALSKTPPWARRGALAPPLDVQVQKRGTAPPAKGAKPLMALIVRKGTRKLVQT